MTTPVALPVKPGSPEEALRHQQFLARRAAAYQAYYEHMPLRRTAIPQRTDMLLYRRLTWGDLAEFSVLDTRQYRSDFPCGRGEKNRCAAAMDPAVTMTGVAQERWLMQGLERSHARWNVLAQQVLMAQLEHQRDTDKKLALTNRMAGQTTAVRARYSGRILGMAILKRASAS
jgi:phosphodiesterase/alkaline phosphatase D-like protein